MTTSLLLFVFIHCNYLLCFISWWGWKIQDISQECDSSTDRGWVYQDPKSKTGTTWKDINEGTDPSHCEYHKCSPGRPGCTGGKGMSRKTAAGSVKRLPATRRNVELLSRLALHHTERVYFANDSWEVWGRYHGTAGWGDMLGGKVVLKHQAVTHLILGCVNDTKYLQRLSAPQLSKAGDTRFNYKQVMWDMLKAEHALEYPIRFSSSS